MNHCSRPLGRLLTEALGDNMDVGWEAVVFIWFCFLWPAAFAVIYKVKATARGTTLNIFLAILVSYVVYVAMSYLPTMPLWLIGVESFIEMIGEKLAPVYLLGSFAAAMALAAIILLRIFRKLEKEIVT